MKEIAKNVYHIPLMPRSSINSYLIEGVLVDSGIRCSYSILRKAIQAIPAHAHVLTHAHADNQGCTHRICSTFNLPLMCHISEVWRTETGLVTKDYPEASGMIAKFQQKYWAGGGAPVDSLLKEGDWLGNFRVIETPGHSSGHLSFFREKDGVLIAGDVAANMNHLTTVSGLHLPPKIFTTDMDENRHSLTKLAGLNPEIICFGHGPVLYNKKKQFEKFVNKNQIYEMVSNRLF